MTISQEHYDKLVGFRLRTFADKANEIAKDPAFDAMTFIEKLAVCIDAESDARWNRKITKRNREARFSHPGACVESIEYLPERNLNRDTVARIATCDFITERRNVIALSKTGGGKSFVIQAIGNAACRKGYTVRYIRHADLSKELSIARKNGSLYEKIDAFVSVDLLVLDDLFLSEMSMVSTTDLFEIIESRMGKGSLVIASQLTPEEWHLRIDTKIIADALLDRVVHNSYLVKIEGPNMREYYSTKKS
jgi:DNA replication protein DnaC